MNADAKINWLKKNAEKSIIWLDSRGFKYSAWAGIFKYKNKYYYVEHDGTANEYFYPHSCAEVSAEEAKKIITENFKDFETVKQKCSELDLTITEEEYERMIGF